MLYQLQIVSLNYQRNMQKKEQEASIRYVLSMTKEESSNFYEIIKQNIYSSKQDKFIQLDEKNIKLVDFLKFEYVYFVDIRTNERTMRYYLLCEKANYSISENHKFILGTKEKPLVITNKKSEEQYEIKEKVIVNIDEYDIGENECEEITAERLNVFFCGFGTEIAKKVIPNVLFWEQKDQF